MTKEEFINGEWFHHKSDSIHVFKFLPSKTDKEEVSLGGSIVKAYYRKDHSTKETLDNGWYDSEANVDQIGRDRVHAYSYVMGKRVSINFRISDLKKINS